MFCNPSRNALSENDLYRWCQVKKIIANLKATRSRQKKSYGDLAISHLKKRALVQVQGGTEFQPAVILKYSEELKQGTNTETGPKNFFEIAYRVLTNINWYILYTYESIFKGEKNADVWVQMPGRYRDRKVCQDGYQRNQMSQVPKKGKKNNIPLHV